MQKKKSDLLKFQEPFYRIFDNDSKICNISIYILLAIFLFLGLFLLNDYGRPWDEYEEITIYIGNLKEYARLFFGENCKFNQLTSFIDFATDNPNIDHGGSIYYLLAPFAHLFVDGHQQTFIYLWRFTIHLFFLCGVFFLYLIVKKFTSDSRYGLLAALMLLLSPRFFAESYYNNKDIAQLTLWLAIFYLTLRWIEDGGYRWGILLGITAAFTVNMRFIGVMAYFVCGLTYCFRLFKEREKLLTGIFQGLASIFTFFLVLFLITPACWKGLFSYFFYCLFQASSFPWSGKILFFGHFYLAKDLPRIYLPIMIAITTPFLFILLFITGNILPLRRRKSLGKRCLRPSDYKYILLAAVTYFPLLMHLILKPVIYNGWRHYYFLYGFIIIWAVIGFRSLLSLQKKTLTKVVSALLAVQLIFTSVLIGICHPFQFTYYNFLAGFSPEETQEMDYWGVSAKQALEELVDNYYKGIPLKIIGAGYGSETAFNNNLQMLSKEDRSKLEVAESIKEAAYLLVNPLYYKLYPEERYPDLSKYKEVIVIRYLSSPIMIVYET